MSVVYTIEFQVASGQRDRFLDLLKGVLDAMRKESTFEMATLSVDPRDDHRFFLHEGWADHEEVLSVQLSRPYRSAWHEALNSLLSEPRRIRIWTSIRSDFATSAMDGKRAYRSFNDLRHVQGRRCESCRDPL